MKERKETAARERRCSEADCFNVMKTCWAGFAEGRASRDGIDKAASEYETPCSPSQLIEPQVGPESVLSSLP